MSFFNLNYFNATLHHMTTNISATNLFSYQDTQLQCKVKNSWLMLKKMGECFKRNFTEKKSLIIALTPFIKMASLVFSCVKMPSLDWQLSFTVSVPTS